MKWVGIIVQIIYIIELPWWLRWYRICMQCRRPCFDPWLGKIPWRREWQYTPVLLPRNLPWTRSLASYSPGGGKESDMTERLTLSLSTYILIVWFCFHSESLIQKEKEESNEKSWCRDCNHRQEWATKSEECNFFWEKRNWNRYFVSVVFQLLSPVWLSATPPHAAQQASLSSTVSWSLLKFMSFESVLLLLSHFSRVRLCATP